jgi:hypothetical protein
VKSCVIVKENAKPYYVHAEKKKLNVERIAIATLRAYQQKLNKSFFIF